MNVPANNGSTPLISIITPYRDARRFLPGLVYTLKNQTYQHWECLLVDHASSDGGGLLTATLTAGDRRFRHLKLVEGGVGCPAIPRNAALKHVLGSLLCFLDVDDLWHPEKLERQLAFHQQCGLDVSVTAYARTREHRPGSATWRCPPPVLELRRLRRSNAVPMLTVMVAAWMLQASQRDEVPLYFQPMPHEDYVMWLQLWQLYPALRYGCLPELLALHQRHGGNITSKRADMIHWLFAVHLHQAPAPVALWRALVGCCNQLLLVFKECLGIHFIPFNLTTFMSKEPLSTLRL